MKRFCESRTEHAMEIINFKKKKIQLLTSKHRKSYQNAKFCYIYEEKVEDKHVKDKKCTGTYRVAAHSICNLKYRILIENHFVTNELAEEFEKQFTSLRENTEKYITFTVPIENKHTRIDKNKEIPKTISYRDYNLLIAQDLWQAYYQILIILLKLFVKLNVNTDT